MKTDYEHLYKESYNIAKKLGKFLKNIKKTVIFIDQVNFNSMPTYNKNNKK